MSNQTNPIAGKASFLIHICFHFLVCVCAYGQDISLVADINKSPTPIPLSKPYILNNKLYFNSVPPYPCNAFTASFDSITSQLAYTFNTNNSYVFDNRAFLVSDSGKLWEYDGITSPKLLLTPENENCLPEELTSMHSKLYFTLNDSIHGSELWVYDGIRQPALLFDIIPGKQGSNPRNLMIFNDNMYFTINESLWKYDGMGMPLKDTMAGSIISGLFIVANDRLYYVMHDDMHGNELWQYDGINPPTLVSDIFPGTNSSDPANFVVLNNHLFFSANDSLHKNQFWFHDGTNLPVISAELKDLKSTKAILNGKLYFIESYNDLYVYDGISSPRFVLSFPGVGINNIFEYNGLLYYTANESHAGYSIWEYDGTNPPRMPDLGITWDSDPITLTVFNGKLYFFAYDQLNRIRHLYVYDVVNQPVKLSEVEFGDDNYMVELNKKLFITNRKKIFGLDSLNTLKELFNISGFGSPVVFNHKIYFISMHNNRASIFSFDGINAPEFVVYSLISPGLNNYIHSAVFNKALYVNASDSLDGEELWAIDTTGRAYRIADINPGSDGSGPSDLTVFGNNLFFRCLVNHMRALWKYDGKSFPEKLVDLEIYPSSITEFNNKLYFSADNSLWEYDGITYPTKIFSHGQNFALLRSNTFFHFNNKLIFQTHSYSENALKDYKTWEYDGHTNPKLLRIDQAVNGSFPDLTILGDFKNNLYLCFDDICNQRSIFYYDGENPLTLIKDEDNFRKQPSEMVEYKGKLYFTETDAMVGRELFALDSPDTSLTIKTCGSYYFNGQHITQSGIYFDTVPDQAGNDSLIRMALYIGSKNFGSSELTTCDKYLSPSGKYNWTQSGTYTDTIPNLSGCDSIITIHLTLTHIDPSVIETDSGLVAAQENANYQWMNCDNHSPLDEQVSQFLPTVVPGNYAVVISDNGCADTSACYAILPTDIGSDPLNSIILYPNPTNGSFTINLGKVFNEVRIIITSSNGEKIHEKYFQNTKMIIMNPDIPPGSYLVSVFAGDRNKMFKLIRNRQNIPGK